MSTLDMNLYDNILVGYVCGSNIPPKNHVFFYVLRVWFWERVIVKRSPVWLGNSIWIPHTPCERFKKNPTQGECEFQIDMLIQHFSMKYLLPLW